MKEFRSTNKLSLVGTRCSASVLGFTVADAQQRVPTLNFSTLGKLWHIQNSCKTWREVGRFEKASTFQ